MKRYCYKLWNFGILACLILSLSGCGALTGLPGHGGGKHGQWVAQVDPFAPGELADEHV